MRSAEQLFMSDTTQKKKRDLAKKQKQLENKMAEIREIEQLQTISEDDTDREQLNKSATATKNQDLDNSKREIGGITPDLSPSQAH